MDYRSKAKIRFIIKGAFKIFFWFLVFLTVQALFVGPVPAFPQNFEKRIFWSMISFIALWKCLLKWIWYGVKILFKTDAVIKMFSDRIDAQAQRLKEKTETKHFVKDPNEKFDKVDKWALNQGKIPVSKEEMEQIEKDQKEKIEKEEDYRRRSKELREQAKFGNIPEEFKKKDEN